MAGRRHHGVSATIRGRGSQRRERHFHPPEISFEKRKNCSRNSAAVPAPAPRRLPKEHESQTKQPAPRTRPITTPWCQPEQHPVVACHHEFQDSSPGVRCNSFSRPSTSAGGILPSSLSAGPAHGPAGSSPFVGPAHGPAGFLTVRWSSAGSGRLLTVRGSSAWSDRLLTVRGSSAWSGRLLTVRRSAHGPAGSSSFAGPAHGPTGVAPGDDVTAARSDGITFPRRTLGTAVPISTGVPFFHPAAAVSPHLRSQILAVLRRRASQDSVPETRPPPKKGHEKLKPSTHGQKNCCPCQYALLLLNGMYPIVVHVFCGEKPGQGRIIYFIFL